MAPPCTTTSASPAFATHAVVDTRSVVAVGDDVPLDVAALLGCAVLTGGGALVNAAPPEPGQSVMVVGLGGVGMAALLTAVALGAGDVVAVDGVAGKRDRARELGATRALDPAELASGEVRATSSSRPQATPEPSRPRSPPRRPAVAPSPSGSLPRTRWRPSRRCSWWPRPGP